MASGSYAALIVSEMDIRHLRWLAEQAQMAMSRCVLADEILRIADRASERPDATPVLRRLVTLKQRKDAEGEFPGYREQKDLAWRDAEVILSFSGSPGV